MHSTPEEQSAKDEQDTAYNAELNAVIHGDPVVDDYVPRRCPVAPGVCATAWDALLILAVLLAIIALLTLQ